MKIYYYERKNNMPKPSNLPNYIAFYTLARVFIVGCTKDMYVAWSFS